MRFSAGRYRGRAEEAGPPGEVPGKVFPRLSPKRRRYITLCIFIRFLVISRKKRFIYLPVEKEREMSNSGIEIWQILSRGLVYIKGNPPSAVLIMLSLFTLTFPVRAEGENAVGSCAACRPGRPGYPKTFHPPRRKNQVQIDICVPYGGRFCINATRRSRITICLNIVKSGSHQNFTNDANWKSSGLRKFSGYP